MTENEIARIIVDASYKVHTQLGPGLLESVYEAALAYELQKRGLWVETQVPIPVIYEKVHLNQGFVADLVVEDKVFVELEITGERRPGTQEAALDLSPVGRQEAGATHQFRGDVNQTWNYPGGK